MNGKAYIGDGVYASFDGCQIWLTAEVEGRTHSIALDSNALQALADYEAAVQRGDVEPTEAPR